MSDQEPRRPKRKRYLLTAVALSTGTLMSGCGSHQATEGGGSGETRTVDPEPMPGNPKGSVYDEGAYEADETDETQDQRGDGSSTGEAGDSQGENAEAGEADGAGEAGAGEAEAGEADEGDGDTPGSGPTVREREEPLPLPGNPKGAVYDDGAFD